MNRNEKLREILRQGDPAAGEPGLSAEELQAMRRTVLNAVPERRRFALIPALATGAAVALAVLLAVVLWRGEEQGTRPPEVKVAVRPAPPVQPAAPPVTPGPPAAPEPQPPAEPEPAQEPVRKRQAAPRVAPPPPPVLPEPEPLTELASVSEPSQPEPALEEPRGRHVEFSTPGGTRVIWVLTEDETLLD